MKLSVMAQFGVRCAKQWWRVMGRCGVVVWVEVVVEVGLCI